MKVLFLTPTFPPLIGGMESYALELVKRVSRVHDVTVICPKESKNIKIARTKILPILPRLFISREDISIFANASQKEKPDLLHILSATHSPFSIVAKYISEIPVVVTCHGKDFLNPWSKFFWQNNSKKLVRLGLLSCDCIIAVSHYTQRKLLDLGINAGKVKVVFNGVDHKRFRPKKSTFRIPGVNSNDNIILTVSRLAKRKGFETVMQSLPFVLKKFPNLKYVIAGGIEKASKSLLTEIKEAFSPFLRRLGIEKNVIYVGAVNNIELLHYYNLCDIFIMVPKEIKKDNRSIDVEGFGIVYLEANACGKPVIASCSGGITDAVVDGETGFLVEPNNITQTAEAIIRLLKDEKLRQRLGKQGRKRVEREFTWDRIAQSTMDIYEKCPKNSNHSLLKGYDFDKMCNLLRCIFLVHSSHDKQILESLNMGELKLKE